LRAFVLLYTFMSIAILGLIGALYYGSEKSKMLSDHRLSMQLEGESYLPVLVRWMQGEIRTFPEDPAYETAFYLNGKRIAGRLALEPEQLAPGIHASGSAVYLVISMGSYGLKEGKTVMMTQDDRLWLKAYWRTVALYGSLLFILFLGIGVGLSRLFLRPMKEAVRLLDHFIKDTTHELNMPVTAILTNIERLQTDTFSEKERKKILRIETAARTIGSIYDDLTFLLLRSDAPKQDVPIDLGRFVRERLDYFQTRFEAKRLQLHTASADGLIVHMDRRLLSRLIDNVLSNAVKYSDMAGRVDVTVSEGRLIVSNTGPEIPEAKRQAIFERYVRADESRGGFGIGLHLAGRIARQYGILIEVASKKGKTTFTLLWPRYTLQSS